MSVVALFYGTAFVGQCGAPDMKMWVIFLAVGVFNILLGMSLTGCNHGARKVAAFESLCQILAVTSLAIVGMVVTGLSPAKMILLAGLAVAWNAANFAILFSPTIKKACDGKRSDMQADESCFSYGRSGVIIEIAMFLFAAAGVALAVWVAFTAVSVMTPPQPIGIMG